MDKFIRENELFIEEYNKIKEINNKKNELEKYCYQIKNDINEYKENIGNKNELCNYLIDRFYNDGYHGIQEERVIWDISVIAYMINKNWFVSESISCPNIKDDTSYEITTKNHKITMVNNIDVDKVYKDLFIKLG